MLGYTIVRNEIFESSQLSIPSRYLYCLLLKFCGARDWCFPGQTLLATILGCTERHIRTLLDELIVAGLIIKTRSGWNRPNTYKVTKDLKLDRKGTSYHLGSELPLHRDSAIPPNNTYVKGKDNKNLKGLESMRLILIKKNLLRR